MSTFGRTQYQAPSSQLAGTVVGIGCRHGADAGSAVAGEAVDYPANLYASLVIVHRGALRPAGDAPVPPLALSGVRTRPSRLLYSGDLESTTVAFYPGRGSALFGVPADRLRDRFVDAREVLQASDYRELVDAAAAHDPAERVAAVERFLAERLHRASYRYRHLTATLTAISGQLAGMSIGTLAEHLEMTPKTMQRWFGKTYGVGPKPMLRIIRTQAMLRRLCDLAGSREGALKDVAQEGGFADQAHLNRDFKALVGITPGAARDVFRSAGESPHHLVLSRWARLYGAG